jgi:hypothetical protein
VIRRVTTSVGFAVSQVERVERYVVKGPEDWREQEEWQREIVEAMRWVWTWRSRMPSSCRGGRGFERSEGKGRVEAESRDAKNQ